MALNSNGEDLLYTLAYECESQFNKLIQALQKAKPEGLIVELCSEYQQRFAIWTAYLGVFARKSQCLDTRLRKFPDLQDLVARLLDILCRSLQSLQHCLAETAKQTERRLVLTSDNGNPHGASQMQTTALETIDNTITRLNRLGITIRQSSISKIDMKAKHFAAGPNMDSFACLCVNAVQALYPGASQPLKDYLSESMISRYAKMSFSSFRNQNLKTRRGALPPIEEIPGDEAQTDVHMTPSSEKVLHSAVSRFRGGHNAPTVSDLSSVDPRQIMSRGRQPDEASTKLYKTSSIQVKQGNYPQLPRTDENNSIFACSWCGQPLNKNNLSETDWRQHIDQDLKPYVCLSEECLDAHSAYPTFNQWHRHMELHDWRWYQKSYLTSSWVCPLCGPSNNAYTDSNALYLHLTKSHDDGFSATELQAISRQSKVEQQRARNDCLLCCFTIDERNNKDASTGSKRRRRKQKQKVTKSLRANLEMTSPGYHTSNFDLSDTSSDSDNEDLDERRRKEHSNAVARHIAAHLQVLMLLTLRFAALQSDGEDLYDDIKSNSVDTDERNSADSEDADLERLSHLSSLSFTTEKDTDDGNQELEEIGLLELQLQSAQQAAAEGLQRQAYMERVKREQAQAREIQMRQQAERQRQDQYQERLMQSPRSPQPPLGQYHDYDPIDPYGDPGSPQIKAVHPRLEPTESPPWDFPIASASLPPIGGNAKSNRPKLQPVSGDTVLISYLGKGRNPEMEHTASHQALPGGDNLKTTEDKDNSQKSVPQDAKSDSTHHLQAFAAKALALDSPSPYHSQDRDPTASTCQLSIYNNSPSAMENSTQSLLSPESGELAPLKIDSSKTDSNSSQNLTLPSIRELTDIEIQFAIKMRPPSGDRDPKASTG